MTQNGDLLLIGDSWVSKGKLDAGLAAALGEPVEMRTIARPGATTSEILASVIAGPLPAGPGEALIVAGANDLARFVKPALYAANLLAIASLLALSGRSVTILSMPDLRRVSLKQTLRASLQLAMHRKLLPGSEAYRDALTAAAGATRPLVNARIVDFADFGPCFFQDRVHLTPHEYKRLGYFLGRTMRAA